MAVKRKSTDYLFLQCKIARGLFDTERQITVDLVDGRKFIAFVDERNVKQGRALNGESVVNGWVRVSPVKVTGKNALVDLPQGSFTEGPRIQVLSKELTQTE